MFFSKKKVNSNSVLGVDLNREQLKIVELEKINNDPNYDFKILNYIVHNLPKGLIHNNDNVEPQILGEQIRDIVEKENFVKKQAIVAVPSERLVVKTLRVPLDSSEDEIENLIKSSSKTHAINGIETMAFDFYEDKERETDEEKFIVLKMCPIEAVQTREDALRIGELTPAVIETDDLPLNRLAKTFYQQYKEETGGELKNKDAFMVVEIRKQLILTHTYQNGSIQASKTEILKREMATEEDIQNQIVDLLKKTTFVAKSNTDNLKAIYLSGKMDSLYPVLNLLEADETFDDLEILIANPLLRIKYSGVNKEAVTLAAPSLTLACGLAMREKFNNV
jgi:type IV pilus assembly protein PilM